MTKLDNPPPPVAEARAALTRVLAGEAIGVCDANSITTGRDFLLKIWELMVSVPLGIAIVYEKIPPRTMGNVLFELGRMQALGKETLIIRVGKVTIPSDLVRHEYVQYEADFEARVRQFLDHLSDVLVHCASRAEDFAQSNPILAIDYLRRAYSLTQDPEYARRARELIAEAHLPESMKDGVDELFMRWCPMGIVATEAAAGLAL